MYIVKQKWDHQDQGNKNQSIEDIGLGIPILQKGKPVKKMLHLANRLINQPRFQFVVGIHLLFPRFGKYSCDGNFFSLDGNDRFH